MIEISQELAKWLWIKSETGVRFNDKELGPEIRELLASVKIEEIKS